MASHHLQWAADPYGFGAAAISSLHLFEMASRATGRTSRLVELVQDGDQIVCGSPQEASRLKSLLRRTGKTNVRVVFVPTGTVPMGIAGTTPNGRTFFDHGWILRHYEQALRSAQHELEVFARELSKTWPERPNDFDSAGAKILTEFARTV